MKNLIIAFMALFCITAVAQENRNEKREHKNEMRQRMQDLTPEQMAELATKKLALYLDLTEKQQVAVQKLELEQAIKRKENFQNKTDRKQPTDTERFEMKTKRMDDQIAMKKQMKSILTEEQFQKWEEGLQSRKREMRAPHKKDGVPKEKY